MHTAQKETFEKFHTASRERIKEIEETYQEKLRLEGPTDYWEGLKTEYTNKGRVWTGASCVLVGAVLGGLVYLLYDPPIALREDVPPIVSIKTGLLIAFGISISAYLVTLFVKLATSAFHLSRDAGERLQLTHMFLSLVNEKAIDPDDRQVVLQALFSRADTGLLKHDGTPVMASPLAAVIDTLNRRSG